MKGANPVATTYATGAIFPTNNTKFYVPFVILLISNNIKFLENIKQGFERTFSCNKYRKF